MSLRLPTTHVPTTHAHTYTFDQIKRADVFLDLKALL